VPCPQACAAAGPVQQHLPGGAGGAAARFWSARAWGPRTLANLSTTSPPPPRPPPLPAPARRTCARR
jgi:hypothetical protein